MLGRFTRGFFLVALVLLMGLTPAWADQEETSEAEQQEDLEVAERIPEEGIELDEMVVIGSREAVDDPDKLPVPVQVVTRKEIESIGAISLGQVLEVTLGVDLVSSPDLNTSPGFQTVRMRGMDINQVLVLVDGKRLPGSRPTNQGYSFSNIGAITVPMIERIEVLRDGASAQYGSDALAGVINIVTKKNLWGASANGQYGLSSRGDGQEQNIDASGGFPLGRFHFDMGAFYNKREHYDRTENERWDSPDVEQTGAFGGVSFDITHHQVLDLDVRYAQTQSWFRKDDYSSRDMDKEDLHASLLWKGESARWKYQLGTSYTTEDEEHIHTEEPDYLGDLDWDVFEYYNGNVTWKVKPWLSLFAGSSWSEEKIDSQQRDFANDRSVNAVFAEMGLTPLRGLRLQLSGRFEYYSDFGDNFAPKFAARYEIIPALSIRASIAKSFQVPTLFQLHDAFTGAMGWLDLYGNPDLSPSDGLSSNVGLVCKIARKYGTRLALDFYYNRVDNLIETVTIEERTPTENAVATYENIPGTSEFKGVEVDFSTELLYGFGLDILANYLDAKDPDGYDLKNRPRSGLLAVLRYNWNDRIWANFRYSYRGKYISDLNERVESFDIISGQANFEVTPNIVIFLGARNILDEFPPVDLEDYETGHMQGMIDSGLGAFYYAGLRLQYFKEKM
jgi:outer membrane receptor for ferrienterochelin and colicins